MSTGNQFVDKQLDDKGLAKELSQELDNWKRLLQSKEWKKVVEYLEDRYVGISDTDVDSIKSLAARNARLDEIKRLFTFIKHDYNSKEVRLRQLFLERAIEGEDEPVPFIPY